MLSRISWSTFGFKLTCVKRVSHMKGPEGLTPSISEPFPSSVTVYIGDKSYKSELT